MSMLRDKEGRNIISLEEDGTTQYLHKVIKGLKVMRSEGIIIA